MPPFTCSMEKSKVHFLEAIATLVGTVIGAGIIGIPYVVAKAGFWTGIIDIIIIGLAIMITNLYVGEISLRTKERHQLTGFAKIYLGKWGKRLMAFSMVFGVYGALIAYTIGEGEALSAVFGGSPFIYSIIFFAIMSLLIFTDLKMIKRVEIFLASIFLLIVILIGIFSFSSINLSNLATFDLSKIFLPYGVVLFAFLGAAAIPEMEAELIKEKKKLKKAIIIGSLIPLVVYLLFAFFVVGVTGKATTEVATIGLGQIVGPEMIIFGNVFAMFTMATSFLTLGLALKWMYAYDYNMNKSLSWFITCTIPLVAFLLGVKNFIQTIGIVGGLAGGIEGILIILMINKAKKKSGSRPEYSITTHWLLSSALIALFVFGILYSIL